MKVCYLGAGTWGFSLACLLASKGYQVVLWGREVDGITIMQKTRRHPKLPNSIAGPTLTFTTHFAEALTEADVIVESVTTQGIRPVFQQFAALGGSSAPIVITSKGIEQDRCLLIPEIVIDVLGEKYRNQIGCISGPSHAEEVASHLPTSIVSSAYNPDINLQIHDWFTTPFFRVYPNSDLNGVCFGGAMKNVIAIACGISDGLGFGDNTKAALMTRGLHEMRKLAAEKKANPDTLNGLSGLGDLCVTCLSRHSRNSKFGRLIGEGLTVEQAQQEVGMVVEGFGTCRSAKQMALKAKIPLPITDALYSILYEKINPKEAVKNLLERTVKEEHL